MEAALAEKAQEIKHEYTHGEERPMGSHLALLVAYNTLVGGFLLARARAGKPLPARVGAGDLLLAGVATHKLSRLIAKDRVTAPLRAPFTEFEEEGGPGEVEEKPRGRGPRRAIGELLVCPFCLGQWVATGILAGLAIIPRTTRFVCSIFAAVAIGDFLQILYKGSEEKLL
ncbi:MAG TPA: DUF1360 domain-containing protein [Solirubrobacterales bacterium]|jgi:hypothetical protein